MKCPTNESLWLATSSLSCPVQLKTFKQSFWLGLNSMYVCACVCLCVVCVYVCVCVCVCVCVYTSTGGRGRGQPGVAQTERGDGQLSTHAVPNKHRHAHAHTHTQTNTIQFRLFQSSEWSNGVLSSYPVLALSVMSPASSPTLDSLSGEPHVSSLDCWRKQNSRSPSHTISFGLLTSVSFSFLHNFTFPLRPISKYYTIQCFRQQESLVFC